MRAVQPRHTGKRKRAASSFREEEERSDSSDGDQPSAAIAAADSLKSSLDRPGVSAAASVVMSSRICKVSTLACRIVLVTGLLSASQFGWRSLCVSSLGHVPVCVHSHP